MKDIIPWDWQPIETAPKDRIIRLRIPFADEFIEEPGWWEPGMNAWSSGPMTSFDAIGWMEPTYEDGLLISIVIARQTTVTSVEQIQQREAIISNIVKELDRYRADL